MRLLLRIALFAASIGNIGTAHASAGNGAITTTQSTEIPGVIAQAHTWDNHTYPANQNGSAYASQQRSSAVRFG